MRKAQNENIVIAGEYVVARYLNLVFGDIFKENPVFQRISKETVRIVSYFHGLTFFTENLRDEQERIDKKTIKLISPCCLKLLSAKFNSERANIIRTNGIPNVEVDKRFKRGNGERKLPDDIADSETVLNHTKVLEMSKIRNDILYQRQIKEVNQADKNMQQLHIATPIAADDDFDDFDKEQNIDEKI
ncbi:hypothetical protein RCL_jg9604.t1 [Rhizophagus clarus]|uniref:Uncharacterized protein n=1 Tax=Rhizophagus clarus TaxID=94130 RepID=A0A8H3QWN9_9GLOM|nr:hypothetical protein RCL_jg9604.t1 [Rhizophagus clarus]